MIVLSVVVMYKLLNLWLLSVFLFTRNLLTVAIEINYIKVPNAVRNDSHRPVILDCNYSIRPDDTDLVLQWFLNEDLVYQWIPPQKPQSIGFLKDDVDLTYRATDDPKTVYRALKINNPITNLAGEYKCLVSTMGDQDSRIKNMIVFEPEKNIHITKVMDDKYVNFTCTSTDVYPSPKLYLYKDIKNDFHSRIRLSITEWNIKRNPKTNRYTTFITGTDKVSELRAGTLIHCELKIPGTGYIKIKSLLYYPRFGISGNGCFRKNTVSNIMNLFFGSALILVRNITKTFFHIL